MLEDALESLDDRAKSGKTAKVLIAAAEAEAQRSKDLMSVCRVQEQEVIRLTEENDKLRSTKRSTEINGKAITFRYTPHEMSDRDRSSWGDGYRAGLWRLDEIESALMHLRISGGKDDTRVTVKAGVLKAAIGDDGMTPSPWSFTVPEDKRTFLDRLSLVSIWLAPLLAIAGGFGWAL